MPICPSKPANTRGILFREQEAGYLSGWLAIKELMSQKKPLVIGAVGGVKIPPVDRYIAGYQAGAKAANAKAKVLYGYSQSFTDQSKCKEIALEPDRAGLAGRVRRRRFVRSRLALGGEGQGAVGRRR